MTRSVSRTATIHPRFRSSLLAALALGGCVEGVGPRGVEPQQDDREQAQLDVGDEGDSSTGTIDICPGDEAGSFEMPSCPELDGRQDCVPKDVYHKVAAGEYFNTCRNYCYADEHCYDRATAMLGALDSACSLDLHGPDAKWCGPFTPPDSTGTCDDLVYKVVIRYPDGGDWTYHIATMVTTCEDGQCMIDPIGKPASSPTTSCVSPQDWCKAWAHGDTVEWHDTNDLPPKGKVYCEIVPGDQRSWRNGSVSDPTDAGTVGRVCKALEDHVKDLCDDGKSPYPIGCGKDRDGDGIPDDYDKCPDSKPGAVVSYCDAKRLGCAADEDPPATEQDEEDGDAASTGGDVPTPGGDVPTPTPGGDAPTDVPEPQ